MDGRELIIVGSPRSESQIAKLQGRALTRGEVMEIVQAHLMVKMRAAGGSVRGIAKFFGMSKSTLYRQWKIVELQARGFVSVEDIEGMTPDDIEAVLAEPVSWNVSQMGHLIGRNGYESNTKLIEIVPNGTETRRES